MCGLSLFITFLSTTGITLLLLGIISAAAALSAVPTAAPEAVATPPPTSFPTTGFVTMQTYGQQGCYGNVVSKNAWPVNQCILNRDPTSRQVLGSFTFQCVSAGGYVRTDFSDSFCNTQTSSMAFLSSSSSSGGGGDDACQSWAALTGTWASGASSAFTCNPYMTADEVLAACGVLFEPGGARVLDLTQGLACVVQQ